MRWGDRFSSFFLLFMSLGQASLSRCRSVGIDDESNSLLQGAEGRI